MQERQQRLADFEVDQLTNSIENALTRETFNTEIMQLQLEDSKLIMKADWQFNWKKEFKDNLKEVYKLSTVNNPAIIHGLLSIEDKGDHIFMHLVESAKFNKGKNKAYLGVPGNLVAFACKKSIEKSYDGYVAFDSKTVLIEHYKKTLGATHLRGQRMYIDDNAAKRLIEQYFKT
jgi:hypothetical protein